MITKSHIIKVGGLLWSLDLLSGEHGHVNPDNGIYYYTQKKAIAEAEKQGLRLPPERSTNSSIAVQFEHGVVETATTNGASCLKIVENGTIHLNAGTLRKSSK